MPNSPRLGAPHGQSRMQLSRWILSRAQIPIKRPGLNRLDARPEQDDEKLSTKKEESSFLLFALRLGNADNGLHAKTFGQGSNDTLRAVFDFGQKWPLYIEGGCADDSDNHAPRRARRTRRYIICAERRNGNGRPQRSRRHRGSIVCAERRRHARNGTRQRPCGFGRRQSSFRSACGTRRVRCFLSVSLKISLWTSRADHGLLRASTTLNVLRASVPSVVDSSPHHTILGTIAQARTLAPAAAGL